MRKKIESEAELLNVLKDEDASAKFNGTKINPVKLEKAEKICLIAKDIVSRSRFYSLSIHDGNDMEDFIVHIYLSDLFPSLENQKDGFELLSKAVENCDRWFFSSPSEDDPNPPHNGLTLTLVVRDYWEE